MSSRSLPFTAERLLSTLTSQAGATSYLVGYSGGADSTALLFALKQIEGQLKTPIRAVHVNHGLNTDADQWQAHCEQFCQQFEIPLTCFRVTLTHQEGKGLEAEARHKRYKVISDLLLGNEHLLTAHHADDQAETLLLNLLRGSGVDGLTAMPSVRPLGRGYLQRPLLDIDNSALIQYLSLNHISWLEDPSNQSLDHDRNFIRHQIIPLLEDRWKGVSKRMILTRNAMADARLLLERMADQYLLENLSHPHVIKIDRSLKTDPSLFKLVIRRWLSKAASPSLPARSLQSLCDQVSKPSKKQKIRIQWDGHVIQFFQNQLWLRKSKSAAPCPQTSWPGDKTKLNLGSTLGFISMTGTAKPLPMVRLKISSRKHLDSDTRARGMRQGSQHKQLKNLFQSMRIPAWYRDSIPLCILDNKIVAIGDWYFDDKFSDWMTLNQVKICWQPVDPVLQYIVSYQGRG